MKRILVVDDDYAQRTVLCKYLERQGFDVQAASLGMEGIQKVAHTPSDLVITDYVLGDMTGIEFISHVKALAESNSPPIILITSSLDPAIKEKALKTGAKCVIIKPINSDNLKIILQTFSKSTI